MLGVLVITTKAHGRKSYWEGGDNVILDVSLSLHLAQVKL